MNDNLKEVSTYYLVLEMLDNGETGLLPDLEPISVDSIALELKNRTGLDYGTNARKWAVWFLGNEEHGTLLERSNLHISLKTQDMMEKMWRKTFDK